VDLQEIGLASTKPQLTHRFYKGSTLNVSRVPPKVLNRNSIRISSSSLSPH